MTTIAASASNVTRTTQAPASASVKAAATTSQPVLRQGSKGAAVKQMQTLLAKAGYSPKWIDGDFGPLTAAAVERFQSAHGLQPDGVCGPLTWKALTKGTGGSTYTPPVTPPTGSARQKILSIAQSQVGTKEGAGNSNPYSKSFGRPGEAWCGDFVSWVYSKAGVKMNNCSCPSIVNHLKADGNWKGKKNPAAGDIVLFDWNHDGKADHVGIVKGVNSNGTIQTIEGNTGKPGGGPEGVWEKSRPMSDILGFGNLY